MRKISLDIGSGSYTRGTINIDVNFNWSSPFMHSWKYDELIAPKNEDGDKVLADANYPLPFRDNVFDEVYLVHVIEHLLRPYECLCEVKRVLKKNGIVKVVVPNAQKNLADWRDNEHVFSFTKPTITRLIKKLFKVKEVRLLFNDEDIYVMAVKE